MSGVASWLWFKMGSLLSTNSTEDYDDSSELEEEVSDSSSEDSIIFNYKHSHSNDNVSDSADDIGLDCTTTDAAINSTRAFTTIRLTLPDVTRIEDVLDFYEKVAIVFLLYDSSYCALQALLEDVPKNLLLTWAEKQLTNDGKWQEKLVEALCIIQNYKVLKLFGLSKGELNERFLPNRVSTSLNVDKTKKLLYSICENLSKTETDAFLQLVRSDFRKKGLDFKTFNSGYLEMYMLYWEHICYITQSNMSNIYTIFKQLDHLTICDNLKAIIPETNVPDNHNRVALSFQANPEKFYREKLDRKIGNSRTVDASAGGNDFYDRFVNTSLNEMMSLTSTSSSVTAKRNPDLCYTINNDNPGVCLIITQKNFYTDIEDQNKHLLPELPIQLETRFGTEKDGDELINTFQRFRFTTIVKSDLTHLQIINEIKTVAQAIKDESSLFICIMSHGEEGIIYGVNSCKVEVNAVQNIVCNSKGLLGKPKVLILQSCQGNKCQKLPSLDDELETDSPSNSQVVPVTADVLTFWATVPGYGAIRSKRSGSWFIQSLCKAMKEMGNNCHFEDICTSIVNEVSRMTWSKENEVVAMVPLKMSTLRKQFYLPAVSS